MKQKNINFSNSRLESSVSGNMRKAFFLRKYKKFLEKILEIFSGKNFDGWARKVCQVALYIYIYACIPT